MSGGKEREMREMLGEEEREVIIRRWLKRIWKDKRDREEIYEEVNRLIIELNVYDYDIYYKRMIKEIKEE